MNYHRMVFQSESMARNGEGRISVRITGDGYVYASRAGHDSIAFILVNGDKIGLVECLHVPTNKKAVRAFTGSFDVPPGFSARDVCIMEVREESGYRVTPDELTYFGVWEVGHQTDERVHLFSVNVSKAPLGEPEPEDFREAEQKVVWNRETRDWKAILIMKFMEDYGAGK